MTEHDQEPNWRGLDEALAIVTAVVNHHAEEAVAIVKTTDRTELRHACMWLAAITAAVVHQTAAAKQEAVEDTMARVALGLQRRRP